MLGMAETAPPRPGALRSLVPDIRLPRAVRSEVAIAAPVLLAVWALAGFYGSLGPALAATLLHSSSVVYGGLALFILAAVAAASALVLNRANARSVLYLGIAALIAGIAVTLVAASTDSAAGFFTGTAIAGVGFGSGFQGSIRPSRPARRRAGPGRRAVAAVPRLLPRPGGTRSHRRCPRHRGERPAGYGPRVRIGRRRARSPSPGWPPRAPPPKAPVARQPATAPTPLAGRSHRSGSDAGLHRTTDETDLAVQPAACRTGRDQRP